MNQTEEYYPIDYFADELNALEDARDWSQGLEDVVEDIASRFDGSLSAVVTSEEFERIYRHMEELKCVLKKQKRSFF